MNKSIGNKVFRGAVIIVLVGILGKLTSFLTDAVLAYYLGTTYKSDAFYMVSSVQSVLYPMFTVGIWKVFLPLYKSHLAKEENELADSLTNKAITFFSLISLLLMILLLCFAPVVVSIVAPGFEDETRALCIKLVRIAAPKYFFIIAAAVYASTLQAHEKFLGSQIREVASHIPTILAAIFFYRRFGIEAMAASLVVGGMVRLLIELPFVDWGYRYKPDFKMNSPEFVTMLKRMPSALVSAGVAQLNTLIDKSMASTLPTGTISGLNYGHKLIHALSGLLSSSVATALYPQMIELIAGGKKNELNRLLVKILNIFCVLMLPVSLACVLFSRELVSAVFQRGEFNADSTALTANVFALYSIGIFFIACSTVLSNVFYGTGDTKTPMRISLAGLGINVTLNLVLMHFWGANGLALATSLSAIITFFIRMHASRKYVELDRRKILVTAVKVLLASLLACGLPRLLFQYFTVNKYLVLTLSALIGISLYLILMKCLRVEEIHDLLTLIKRKLRKN